MPEDQDVILQSCPSEDLFIELEVLAKSVGVSRILPEDLVVADESELMLKGKSHLVLELF